MDNLEEEQIVDSEVVEDTAELDYDENDIKENKVLAILSYLGLLALIPYYAVKNSKFARYHAVQGMNLLIVWFGYYLLYAILSQIKVDAPCVYGWLTCRVTPWWINFPLIVLGIMIGIISGIGIYNVIKEKTIELPIVNKIKIFK